MKHNFKYVGIIDTYLYIRPIEIAYYVSNSKGKYSAIY